MDLPDIANQGLSDLAAHPHAGVGVTAVMQGIFSGLPKYTRAVSDEVSYQLLDVLHDENGLISHRRNAFQTWYAYYHFQPSTTDDNYLP